MRKSQRPDARRPTAFAISLLITIAAWAFSAHELRANPIAAGALGAPARETKTAGVGDGKAKKVWAPRNVYAVWYVVPAGSLAKRRARGQEFTAAHNHLPLGTLVRVTHLKNGRSVTARITDRGISNHHAKIDVCKEAAEKLDMIGEGIARVRIEVLETDPSGAARR